MPLSCARVRGAGCFICENMKKRLYAIRGAVCASNTEEDIAKNVSEMCSRLFEKNKVQAEDVVSIQFTLTPDLDALNPAAALRSGSSGIDVSRIPLFVSAEASVKGMMPRVIRVLITAYLPEKSEVQNVYINGAEALRPDL